MNQQEAADYLPLLQAFAEGKTIQKRDMSFPKGWKDMTTISFMAKASCYRIKPTPVLVPLECTDIPPGSVFRHPRWTNGVYWSPVKVMYNLVAFSMDTDRITYIYLMNHGYEIKRPGEDWKPCSKDANENLS